MKDKQVRKAVANIYISLLKEMPIVMYEALEEGKAVIVDTLIKNKEISKEEALHYISNDKELHSYFYDPSITKHFRAVMNVLHNEHFKAQCYLRSLDKKRDALGRFAK